MTEQEIIDKLSLGQRKAPSTHGIGDDGAKVVIEHRVVTCDTMVEGVHWDNKLSAADVGWKIVAINASDIGAMGVFQSGAHSLLHFRVNAFRMGG